jgi:hypothetical protein
VVSDAYQVALPDPVDRQRCNERRSNAASVLGRDDLDGIATSVSEPALPVQNLLECLCLPSLEMRVFVEDGAVRPDMC